MPKKSKKPAVKKIGILTGGGDCPGLNAVIRAITKAAVHDQSWEVVGIEDGFEGLVELRRRELTNHDVSGILTCGGTILGTSNRADPFRYPIKRSGKLIFRDLSDQACRNYHKMGLDALITIGGDGTMSITDRLAQKGLKVVGIPKTIDNDLPETDLTFGFDSAVTTATEAIDKLHTTADAHHRVMVIEVMGRYAGWIALMSGLAGGGDVILIPEIPYDLAKICQYIKERYRQGKRFSIIVAAEGARPKGGQAVVRELVKDSTDQVRLGGIGEQLGAQLEQAICHETRVVVLGHLQRGGGPTAYDRILATRFGVKAVQEIAAGNFGVMVCLKGNDIGSVSLIKATRKLKLVPLDSPILKAARSVGTSFGD